MLITNDFILLNNPKTGSTYCRNVIKTLYRKQPVWLSSLGVSLRRGQYREIMSPNIINPQRPKNQHGSFSQIPRKFMDRKKVSVVRNPYDKFISAYEYKYYLKYPPSNEILNKVGFCDLETISMDDFARLQMITVDHTHPNLSGLQVGSQTIQFIQMFFKEPKETLANLSDEYFDSRTYLSDIGDVTFFDQRNLTDSLMKFLGTLGQSKDALQMLKGLQRVNRNKTRSTLENYQWTDDGKNYVAYRERYLLLMLEDLGFSYKLNR